MQQDDEVRVRSGSMAGMEGIIDAPAEKFSNCWKVWLFGDGKTYILPKRGWS